MLWHDPPADGTQMRSTPRTVCPAVSVGVASSVEQHPEEVPSTARRSAWGSCRSRSARRPLGRFAPRYPETEPWLFAVEKTGRVTTRLEGSFGFDAVDAAIKSALG